MVEYIMIAAGLVIARYVYKKNEAKIKGNRGERKLCRALKRLKLPGNVKVMRDCLFRSEWGTSQIDALAITKYGIIVCEMKNHNGTIYGAVGQSNWTVKYDEHTQNLYSPIKQNNSHVSALTHLLKDKYPRMNYLPLVVFGNGATLHIQNSRNKVCNLRDLAKVVDRQLGDEVLSDQDVSEITSFLENAQVKGRKARRIHATRAQLKADVKEECSYVDLLQFQNEILDSAKNKPIVSSNTFGIYDQDQIHKNTAQDNERLFDKIQAAERKQDRSSQPHNNYFHDHSM